MQAGREEARGSRTFASTVTWFTPPALTRGPQEWSAVLAKFRNFKSIIKEVLFTFSYFLISSRTEICSNCYKFKPSFICKGEELHGRKGLLGSKEL